MDDPLRTCIVNYASGGFIAGQRRLRQEAERQGYEGDFLFYGDSHQLDCPSHQQAPYAFKPHAMKVAADRGYRLLLWCDASVYPTKPMEQIFQLIADTGYLFHMCGFKAGQWCSDAALKTLAVSRDEAMQMEQLVGGCQGLDMQYGPAREYLNRWYELSRDGVTFQGDWTNNRQQVSADPRVRGHRHDQVVGSILAYQLGMTPFRTRLVLYDDKHNREPGPETLFMVRSV